MAALSNGTVIATRREISRTLQIDSACNRSLESFTAKASTAKISHSYA